MRHSQGSVGAPHGLKDCRASDAKSTNVRTADVDRRLVCEHVRKPLYGPRPLIFDRTTSTVEANSLRHPQGDPATATDFGRKLPANSPHGGRMCDVSRTSYGFSPPTTKCRLISRNGDFIFKCVHLDLHLRCTTIPLTSIFPNVAQTPKAFIFFIT